MLENLKHIKEAWYTSHNFYFSCGGDECHSSTYSYAWATDIDHNVFLCELALTRSLNRSIDSLPGILIHEITHFDDVLMAGDYAFGVDGAENLAYSAP